MINLGIACSVYISIDLVYPRSCARRSIVAEKLLQKHELCTKGKFHIMNFLD